MLGVGKFYLGSFQVEALFAVLVIPADVDAVRHDPAEQTDIPVEIVVQISGSVNTPQPIFL